MRVAVNGEQRECEDGTTLGGLLDLLELAPGKRGIAVAVDAAVVPRSAWYEHALESGARVEVVTATGGG